MKSNIKIFLIFFLLPLSISLFGQDFKTLRKTRASEKVAFLVGDSTNKAARMDLDSLKNSVGFTVRKGLVAFSSLSSFRNQIVPVLRDGIDTIWYAVDNYGVAILVNGGGGLAKTQIKRYANSGATTADTALYPFVEVSKRLMYFDSTANRYININRKLTIRDFGAVEGIVSAAQRAANSVAIRAYQNYSPTLEIPKGHFEYDSAIILKNGQGIVGISKDSSVLQYCGNYWAVVTTNVVNNTTEFLYNISVKNISITAMPFLSAKRAKGGLYLRNLIYSNLSDVQIDGYNDYTNGFSEGVSLEGKTPNNTFNVNFTNVRAVHNQLWGFHAFGDGAGGVLNFQNCEFAQNGQGYRGDVGGMFWETSTSNWVELKFDMLNLQGNCNIPLVLAGVNNVIFNQLNFEQSTSAACPNRPLIWLGTPSFRGGTVNNANLTFSQMSMGAAGQDTLIFANYDQNFNVKIDKTNLANGDGSTNAVTFIVGGIYNLDLETPLGINTWTATNKYLFSAGSGTTKVTNIYEPTTMREKTSNTVIPRGVSYWKNNVLMFRHNEDSIFTKYIALNTSNQLGIISVKQKSNNGIGLYIERFTNSSPTGYLINCSDATGGGNPIFSVSATGQVLASGINLQFGGAITTNIVRLSDTATYHNYDGMVYGQIVSTGSNTKGLDYNFKRVGDYPFTAYNFNASLDVIGTSANRYVANFSVNNVSRLAILPNGNIGIGTNTPAAIFDVTSTTQGVLFPRMTTTQRDAISSPTVGLIIFNTTLGKLQVRGASAWETITSL